MSTAPTLGAPTGCPARSSATTSFGPMSTALVSGNPAFNEKIRTQYLVRGQDATMTVAGTALKTLFLLVVLVAAGGGAGRRR